MDLKLHFHVQRTTSGTKPYKDRQTIYVVSYSSDMVNANITGHYKMSPEQLEAFCSKVLDPAVPVGQHKRGFWEKHYTFSMLDELSCQYIVTEPFTD